MLNRERCKWCGKELDIFSIAKYCSVKCRTAHWSAERNYKIDINKEEWLKLKNAEEVRDGIYRKTCIICGRKFLTADVKRKSCGNGECDIGLRNIRREKNRDKIRESARKYRMGHRDYLSKLFNKWYYGQKLDNERYKEYRKKHNESNRKWMEKNPECKEWLANYYKKYWKEKKAIIDADPTLYAEYIRKSRGRYRMNRESILSRIVKKNNLILKPFFK